MAATARALGAEVTVILGPSEAKRPDGVTIVDVTTADQMLAEVMKRVEQVDFFVASAAVSDWKAQTISTTKVKKGDEPQTVTLVRTPDVLLTASTKVHANAKRPVLVGFAAETNDVVVYAKGKLAKKKLDLVVANDVSAAGAGFAVDTNAVTMVAADGSQVNAQGSKADVARKVWERILSI
jgi:phosphopantothenoylcysteine decarboxylase/phosphopantothenate--cysteine ligase